MGSEKGGDVETLEELAEWMGRRAAANESPEARAAFKICRDRLRAALQDVQTGEEERDFRKLTRFGRAVDALLSKRLRSFIPDDDDRELFVNTVASEIEWLSARLSDAVQGGRE